MWYLYSVYTVYNVQTKARERGSRDCPNIDIIPPQITILQSQDHG